MIVAITGASGVIVGQRLLENLTGYEVYLIVSEAAKKVMAYEVTKDELPATARYQEDDLEAPLCSSSFGADAMVIAPCSMKTMAGIAHGYAENLIIRSAENVLRFGRPLIVAPRETPLSLPDIENMLQVRLAGGTILPLNVAYYFHPKTIEDVTDFFVGKILELLGLEHHLYHRWKGRK